MLLLKANHWVSDSELVDAMWSSGPPASASVNLKTYVSQLRQQLGSAERVERRQGAYRLTVARDELDTTIFEDLVERGRTAFKGGDAEAAAGHLGEALELWRGEPFESLDADAAGFERARLTELRWSARAALADALVAAGRDDEAIALLRAMTADDPLRERTWLRLIATLHEGGRRAEALATYQQARAAIVTDLGIDPGPDLRDLHARILRADADASDTADTDTTAADTTAADTADTDAAGPAEPAPSPVPVARASAPRRSPVLLIALAALVVIVLVVGFVVAQRPESPRENTAATTAAARFGWGEPVHAGEFTSGLDGGWTAVGPRSGRDGKGRQLPEQVSVHDGVAVITGLPNGDTGFLARSPGRKHGRWEARVKVPAGCACYRPVLTLWPDANNPPAGGEIVYLEAFDALRQEARFFLYSAASPTPLSGVREVDLTTWNHFAVEWTEDRLTAYVNGEVWYSTTEKSLLPPGAMSPTVKLDLVSGGTVTTSTLEIDWIREYAA
ncbi:BTAD domain-containing putative transcriptional regulator [Nocardia sp. NRRL S-836]|uniref:BTAD domain-containing putative transcriptional regulator n=1 Tax=Nocardia sp. NRRL S-836 TaxID=1519492 RepID=UPI0018D0DA01|nr:BTAD domain-containing putative transcriptional regulator [Nocardia sp. NRRL S-836]